MTMNLSRINRKTRSLFLLPVLALGLMTWTGCEKDYNYVAPKTTPTGGGGGGNGNTTVSFANDIQPIYNSACNMSGCHATGGHVPDLSPGAAYAGTLTYINTANPSNSDLYVRVMMSAGSEGFMPEGGAPLSDEQKAKILTWITEGAQNN
jgi:hypothetical protein